MLKTNIMKSKIFKTMLPAFAILFAISLSFAVESNRVEQTGYYDDPFIPGVQSTSTNCIKNGNGNLCKVGIYQLFETPALDVGDELRQP